MPLSSTKGVEDMSLREMTEVNAKVSEYEAALRDAETAIENACQAICSLRGDFPRYELNKAYETIQDAIRGTWRYYNNPEIEIAR